MYENILVPLDGSENSERAVPHARDMAKAFGATLHLLKVVSVSDELGFLQGGETAYVTTPQYQELVDNIIDSQKSQAEAYLGQVKSGLEAEGISAVAVILEGVAADKIIQYAEESNIDLTVISTRGQGGVRRFLVGSTTDRVIRSGNLPVLAVSPEE